MKVGVGVIVYGAREAAIVDALTSSKKYDVDIYAVDRQNNPFVLDRAREHVVIEDLSDINGMRDFFGQYSDKLSFIIGFGTEAPIIAGVRDVIERDIGVPVICPTKAYTLEASKVAQRRLIDIVYPSANPRYKVFSPKNGKPIDAIKDEFHTWLRELNYQVAIKPNAPGYGKGVGVSGDHFSTPDEMWEHFRSLYEGEQVIVEEKIDGEEFSSQYFSDGVRLVAVPVVRDYKRAYDEDKGPNTGSMGSYSDKRKYLPFMRPSHWLDSNAISSVIFHYLAGSGGNPRLIGIPLYVAYTISKNGLKIFEINSRGGDPELVNTLATLKDDFVDVCFQMINGNLRSLSFKPLATVATYLVPGVYPGKDNLERKIDLSEAKGDEDTKFYPASVDAQTDGLYSGTSRTICVVGIGETIKEARERSFNGIHSIKGNNLRFRNDIASKEHIKRSIDHVRSFS